MLAAPWSLEGACHARTKKTCRDYCLTEKLYDRICNEAEAREQEELERAKQREKRWGAYKSARDIVQVEDREEFESLGRRPPFFAGSDMISPAGSQFSVCLNI